MNPLTIMHVVGARPNFMKIAPLMRQIAAHSPHKQVLVHTGQHYDANMSEVFFEELEIPRPTVNLEVGSGTHAQQTAQVMLKCEPVLNEYKPDWVIVPGDVNSTLACALVAQKLHFKVAHLEAGLRSRDREMPEEINRILTDHLSDLLLTPSRDADQNLLDEGIPPERISFVGNIMIDTLVHFLPQAERQWPRLKQRLSLERFGLVTLHRPNNVDNDAEFKEIVSALARASADLPMVFPVHPRTRQALARSHFASNGNVHLIDPLGYVDFLALQAHAAVVLTDSGGVQEETTYLGTPCLTIRPTTERPVTITNGTNRLVKRSQEDVLQAIRSVQQALPARDALRRPELWDGETSARVVNALESFREIA